MKSLFICCSIFFSISAQARLIDRTAALVNVDVITTSDLGDFTKTVNMRKELDPLFAFFQLDPKTNSDILNFLVQEDLILQKFPVTKDEVDEEVNTVLRTNKIDADKLKGVLSGQGIKFEDYQRLMKVSVSKRKLMDRELRPFSVITDDDVKNYYYTSPEFSERNKGAQNLVLSYGLSQMSFPAAALADKAYQRLKSGDDFDSVASDMASLGAEKSSLGSFSEDKLSESVRSALSGLKVGQCTKPINTGSGYQILKISEIGAPKDVIFEKSKEQIRNQLFRKAMNTQLVLWTERERAQSYIYIPAAN